MSKEKVIGEAASGVTYTASTGTIIFGLTANDLATLALAAIAFLINLGVTVYFKRRHLALVREAAKKSVDCAVCPERET